MEKHKDLTNNTIQDWINSDKKLSGILTEIENLTKSEEEQALIAFHRLSDEYNLPKYPDDVKDREMIQVADWHLYTPLSVYEQLGIVKFSYPIVDKKSLVLLSVYLINNKLEAYFDEQLELFLGEDELLGFGYKGQDTEVEMIPIKVGESWFDKGCIYFTKEEYL
jgi:hypothetical protein